jgi:phospholipid/cholesterol/gamma-HCH transport system substrate-binding protein
MPVIYRRAVFRRRALGAIALLGAVLAVIALWQRPDPFATREIVRADLVDANGLAPIGADVRVAGVPVGKVTGIGRAGSAARLTMTLVPSAGVVHRDATVSLRPRLMVAGTAYVELTLGSPSAPPLGDAVIPRARTSTYVPLADALSVLQPSVRGDVHAVAGAFGGLLSAHAPAQLRDTIAAAPGLTSDAALVAGAARGPHSVELRAAVGSLAHVASAVASQAPALGASLGEAARTAAAVDVGGGVPADRTLVALPGTASALDSGARAASAVVGQLQTLVPRLQPGVAQLTPTLAAVRPLLVRAVPVLRGLYPVLGDAHTALAGAAGGSGAGLSAVRALAPTLQIFQSTLLSALEQPTDLGTPAYLAFLGLFAGGGGASRPFGVDGQGHFMRFGLRFLTGVGLPLPPCTLLNKVSPALGVALQTAGGCTS